jgi:uncharacterized membrane protein (UPF0127 family)
MAEEKKDEVKKVAAAGVPAGFIIVLVVAFILSRKGSVNNNVVVQNPTPTPIVETVTNENLPVSRVLIAPNNQRISVQVADTPKTRDLGLSGFPLLPLNQGMLFVFPGTGNYSFWMKNMKFPIDIIWMKKISGNQYQVVAIIPNARPESYPAIIDPHVEADTVLELNAGKAQEFRITVGSVLMQ